MESQNPLEKNLKELSDEKKLKRSKNTNLRQQYELKDCLAKFLNKAFEKGRIFTLQA